MPLCLGGWVGSSMASRIRGHAAYLRCLHLFVLDPLPTKSRDWERSKERSATGRFFHRVREARGLNQSTSVAQGMAARYMARGMRVE